MPSGGARPGAGKPQRRFTINDARAHTLRRLAKKLDVTPQLLLDLAIDTLATQLETEQKAG